MGLIECCSPLSVTNTIVSVHADTINQDEDIWGMCLHCGGLKAHDPTPALTVFFPSPIGPNRTAMADLDEIIENS